MCVFLQLSGSNICWLLPSLRPPRGHGQAKAWASLFPGYRTQFLHRVRIKACSDGYSTCPMVALICVWSCRGGHQKSPAFTEWPKAKLNSNSHIESGYWGSAYICIYQSRVGLMDDKTLIWCILPPTDHVWKRMNVDRDRCIHCIDRTTLLCICTVHNLHECWELFLQTGGVEIVLRSRHADKLYVGIWSNEILIPSNWRFLSARHSLLLKVFPPEHIIWPTWNWWLSIF